MSENLTSKREGNISSESPSAAPRPSRSPAISQLRSPSKCISDKWERRHSSVSRGTLIAPRNENVLVLLVAVVLVISNTCSGQPSCPGPQMAGCLCDGSYSSRVYNTTSSAAICTGAGAAATTGPTMQDALTSLIANGRATILYTLKIDSYGSTTSIEAGAFDSFSQVRELGISNMLIATIHPTAFVRLTRLVSISLVNLRSGQRGLGFLDFAALLPHTTTLAIVDLSGSRVAGIARGSFANNVVKTLWLDSADFQSLTEDLLVHVTNISLAGTSWTCNACICPLVTKALNITWSDKDRSMCGSPTGTFGRRLDSMLSCGCSGNTTTAATCAEDGEYTCDTKTSVVQLDCSIPRRSAYGVCVPVTSAPTVATTRSAARTEHAVDDEPCWQKEARKFLTGTVGIITVCAVAVCIIALCLLAACCCQNERKKARKAKSAQRLLLELRSNSFRRGQSGGSADEFAFPDFGAGSDGLSFENLSPGSVMQAVSSGLNGDVGSQKKLPHPDKKSPAASPQPTPNPSPQRSLTTSRAGSMISRTSLRNQPIFEEIEDGDPMEC